MKACPGVSSNERCALRKKTTTITFTVADGKRRENPRSWLTLLLWLSNFVVMNNVYIYSTYRELNFWEHPTPVLEIFTSKCDENMKYWTKFSILGLCHASHTTPVVRGLARAPLRGPLGSCSLNAANACALDAEKCTVYPTSGLLTLGPCDFASGCGRRTGVISLRSA